MSPRAPSGGVAGVASLACGTVAFVAAGTGVLVSALGGIGLLAVGLGVAGRNRTTVTLGAALLYGEVLLAGALGLATTPTVLSGVCVVLCWTFGRAAVDVAADVPGGESARLEAVHVVGTGLVAVAAATVSLLASLVAVGEVPALAAALLAVGAVALVAAIRP